MDCGLNMEKLRGSLTKRPRRSGTRGYHPLDLDPAAQIRFAGVLIVVVCYRSDGWTASRRTAASGRRKASSHGGAGSNLTGFVENDAPGVKSTRALVGRVQHAMRNPPGATSRACGAQGGGFDCGGSSAWQSSPAGVRAGLSGKWAKRCWAERRAARWAGAACGAGRAETRAGERALG